MADKYHSDTQEKVETIVYNHLQPTTNDLEAATKTITATVEATGLGNADYNASLTLPKPDDPRLVILKVAARLAATIDSMAATHLYCRVYVDAQDADHRLFDKDWTTTGAKLNAAEWTSGTIFNLLSDGAAHTFYFFFWVDAGNAVISLCQLWEAVGQAGVGQDGAPALGLNFEGEVSIGLRVFYIGSGTPECLITGVVSGDQNINFASSSNMLGYTMVWKNNKICFRSTVSTDISFALKILLNLRSQQ